MQRSARRQRKNEKKARNERTIELKTRKQAQNRPKTTKKKRERKKKRTRRGILLVDSNSILHSIRPLQLQPVDQPTLSRVHLYPN